MLSVRGLTKVYGGARVVQNVNFDLEPGTVTAFLGPNGAGKSTTLRMICGLTRPTAGQALIGGRPFTAWPNPCYVAGALLDASATHPGRSARGQLTLAARLTGLPVRRVDEVLDMVGLLGAANRKIGTYSLGMRQRVALAHAMLADPPLLLLDEPINGLDPDGIRAIRLMLRDHAARGGTVLISSHVLSEVDQTADRVLVINGGQLVADGTMAMFTTSSKCLVRAKDMTQLEDTLLWAKIPVHPRPDGWLLADADVTRVSDVTFEAGVQLLGLKEEDKRLEDVFFQLTQGGAG